MLFRYDALSRLLEADYNSGPTVYTYGYDPAGNLVSMSGVTRTYNAANQMTSDGTNALTYDANGNLTNDGVNTYTWDRANRMIGAPGSTSYKYDGLSNRISQTASSVVTQYLNDTQPGLTKVIAQTTGANTDRFVHGPRGIHAMENHAGDWSYMAQDGLGSVRTIIDNTLSVDTVQSYDPIGNPMGSYGAGFGFTGEQTDHTGQLYLRARYYDPSIGTFTALDLFEGLHERPMSLNGYSWVEGNVINKVDPNGKCWANPTTSVELGRQCREQWESFFPRNIGRVGGSCNDRLIGELFNNLSVMSHADFMTTVQSQEFFDQIGSIGIPVIDECGMVITPCSELQPPSPTVNPSVTIFFGGSDGDDPNAPGPDPALQTPVWIETSCVRMSETTSPKRLV